MNHVREEDRGGNLSTMIRLLKYFPTAFIKRLKNYAIHVHACAALFCNFIACSFCIVSHLTSSISIASDFFHCLYVPGVFLRVTFIGNEGFYSLPPKNGQNRSLYIWWTATNQFRSKHNNKKHKHCAKTQYCFSRFPPVPLPRPCGQDCELKPTE